MKYQPLKKLTPDQIQESIVSYQAGDSLATIAVRYGVTRTSMWDLLSRRIPLRSNLRYGSDNHFYRGGTRADDHAQNILEKAIERGEVTRPTVCESCGDSGQSYRDGRAQIQAHHPDYNKPLDVMWLCKSCHHEWHRHNRAIPAREAV